MNTKQDIQDFLAQKTLAIVGLSRDEKAMSANVNKELKAKGYRMLAVNPNAESIGGEKCYPSLAALALCREKGLQPVSGKCIMMFADPVGSIHGVHRWFAKVFGTLPR